jgi:hypothetical protein
MKMRKIFLGLALVAGLGLGTGSAEAQVTLGPTIAFHGDADFGIGATVGVPLPSLAPPMSLMADFIYFFPDGEVDYWELNGNLTYDFPLQETTVVPFVLAGLNIAHASVSEASDTDLGLNLGGGIAFDLGRFRPSVGLRVELSGGDDFVLFGTLPFRLGDN